MTETAVTLQSQCPNCGQSLTGNFCANSGQPDKEVKRTFTVNRDRGNKFYSLCPY